MTTWLTKELTLDLLAITIHGLTKAMERIEAEPAGECPPAETHAQEQTPVQEQAPMEVQPEPTPAPEPAPVPAPQPGPDVAELRATAQQLLRGIANNGGGQWIAGTLFPHFGIDHLDKLPADKWEELITMAQQHTEEA
ncbi:hypothetical protein [Corynebacterium sp. DNF00584]|uniref:hypothetical protein n=1 Tax=Corynebacterium sp. DNF00584 TaxID=1384076 RepID=UPI000791F84D|nr:hypothetical protein [Corynebacterium sp. DNF00584]KXB52752.1 hypothetical protein HMPREF0307_02070 [Corynebacterium sp. DNF00584]